MSRFFIFEQNNSGGFFEETDSLCHVLIIQAQTHEEANQKAEELGCYWNGVREGKGRTSLCGISSGAGWV